jgi:hypothetical protein
MVAQKPVLVIRFIEDSGAPYGIGWILISMFRRARARAIIPPEIGRIVSRPLEFSRCRAWSTRRR